MLEDITLLELIVTVSIGVMIIIANGWLLWWKSYMTKDGEYKAMEENIGKITREVESIKGDLNYLVSNRISFESEKRKVILEYYADLCAYVDVITTYKVFTHDQLEEISVCINSILAKAYNYRLSEGKLDLFLSHHSELRRAKSQLSHILKVLEKNSVVSYVKVKGNIAMIAIHRTRTDAQAAVNDIQNLYNETDSVMEEFYTGLTPDYANLQEMQMMIQTILRKELEDSFRKHAEN